MKHTIVIAGGGGFVGANLAHRLVTKKQHVHVITRPGGSLWRLADIKKQIVVHPVGLSDQKKLSKLFSKLGSISLYHLATYGSYPTQQDRSQMIATNVTGTLNILQALETARYHNLVVVGSSSEYGKKTSPMKETDVLEPNNYYAATKAAQTHLVQVFAKSLKKPATILRLFNVYGPREEKGRLVRSVIESVLSGSPVKLATGKEARDFIYTDDVVNALIHGMNHKPFFGEVFNIGTGKQTTIKQLAKKVIQLTGARVPILTGVYAGRPWDSAHWKADMTKTRKMLRWHAQWSLTDGLKKTIAWYRMHER